MSSLKFVKEKEKVSQCNEKKKDFYYVFPHACTFFTLIYTHLCIKKY